MFLPTAKKYNNYMQKECLDRNQPFIYSKIMSVLFGASK